MTRAGLGASPRALVALVAGALSLLCASPRARGGEPTTPEIERAREAFTRGAELAKDAQWSAALASFERSAKLRPHPWTTYNLAICERALGQYVRARRTFALALATSTKDADLPEATVADTKRLIAEIDRIVATLDVTIEPPDASIAVDGQPLEVIERGAPPTLLAGTLPAGPGGPPPAPSFRLALDPGTHVFLITREGFTRALHTETVRPGERRAIALVATKLPATLAISANEPEAIVTLDRLDVGVAPVIVERPAGVHHVTVRKPDFDPYEIDATVRAGQRLDVSAALARHKPSVLTRWWFWSAAAVVIGGAAVATYALTRPDPQRPALDGGGLGWSVRVP